MGSDRLRELLFAARRRATGSSWRARGLAVGLSVGLVVIALVTVEMERSKRDPEIDLGPRTVCDHGVSQHAGSSAGPLEAAALTGLGTDCGRSHGRTSASGDIGSSESVPARLLHRSAATVAASRGGARTGDAAPRPATPATPEGGTDPDSTTTTTMLRLRERKGPEVTQLRAGGEVPDGVDSISDDPVCGPTTIPVEAVVVDQSAIRSVTLHWSVDGARGRVTGTRAMQPSAGRHTALLGPFPPGSAPRDGAAVIGWWVEATDWHGNTSRADAPDGSGSLGEDERVALVGCAR